MFDFLSFVCCLNFMRKNIIANPSAKMRQHLFVTNRLHYQIRCRRRSSTSSSMPRMTQRISNMRCVYYRCGWGIAAVRVPVQLRGYGGARLYMVNFEYMRGGRQTSCTASCFLPCVVNFLRFAVMREVTWHQGNMRGEVSPESLAHSAIMQYHNSIKPDNVCGGVCKV